MDKIDQLVRQRVDDDELVIIACRHHDD